MAHEIEINTDADGNAVANYADSQARPDGTTSAWHRLGQAIGRTMTPDEALEAANMKGWDVRKLPLTASIPSPGGGFPTTVEVPNKHLIVRTNPITKATEPLGVIGNWWTPFQNEETTALLYDITEQSGAHIETIASLDGGRRTFVTMKMPGFMEFTSPNDGSRDITDLYLAIFNHHDGQGALRAVISPVRVVCANTQRMAESAAVSSVSIRHTGTPNARLAQVRELLGITFRYQDTFVEECERLIAAEVDEAFVRGVLNDVFGLAEADTERKRNSRVERVSQVMELYRQSDTVAPFRGTAFGAYNAVTEYIDHYMPVSGKGDQEAKRALRTVTSTTLADLKGRAFGALLPA